MGGVYASLNALLEHRRGSAWTEVVGKLLDAPLVQMGPHFAILVEVHTNFKKNKNIFSFQMVSIAVQLQTKAFSTDVKNGAWRLPVGACRAELGMVALSSGTVLVSGSGVLLVGDVGAGLGTTLGFLCTNIHTLRLCTIILS